MAKAQKHLHLMGINGAGMSGIAVHASAIGYKVTGCDAGDPKNPHDPKHVENADLIGASTAIKDDHPEIVAAKKKKVPVLRRDALLREITNGKRVIAISGTHGKTTTSAMTAHILRECGVDASFLIGGNAPTLGGGAGVGKDDWFVLEADESDASFLGPQAEIAVVTNIEPDHLDFYGSYDGLIAAFSKFVSNAKRAIVCADSPDAQSLSDDVITYGFNDGTAEFQLTGRSPKANLKGPHVDVTLGLAVPGKHALLNAAAALLAAYEVGINPKDAAKALKTFANVDRRFSVRSNTNDITIIDDYAHLPTEVEAVIDAARELQPRRLVVAFQPHRYSRTQSIGKEFANSFVGADLLVVSDVYAAGENPREGIDGKIIVDAVLDEHPSTQIAYIPNRDALAPFLVHRLRAGDLLLTLGAGDITKLSEEITAQWQMN
jgi:UDP-N-acetylmuramate--alanine ligase